MEELGKTASRYVHLTTFTDPIEFIWPAIGLERLPILPQGICSPVRQALIACMIGVDLVVVWTAAAGVE